MTEIMAAQGGLRDGRFNEHHRRNNASLRALRQTRNQQHRLRECGRAVSLCLHPAACGLPKAQIVGRSCYVPTLDRHAILGGLIGGKM